MDDRIARSFRAAWYSMRAYLWVAIPFGLILEYDFWTSGAADGAIGAIPGLILVIGGLLPTPAFLIAGGVLGAVPSTPRAATMAPAVAATLGVVAALVLLNLSQAEELRLASMLLPAFGTAFWFAGKRFVERVTEAPTARQHEVPGQQATPVNPPPPPSSDGPMSAGPIAAPAPPPVQHSTEEVGARTSSTFEATLVSTAIGGALVAISLVAGRLTLEHFLDVAFPAFEGLQRTGSLNDIRTSILGPLADEAMLVLAVGAAVGGVLYATRMLDHARLAIVAMTTVIIGEHMLSHSLTMRNLFVAGATVAMAWLLGGVFERRLRPGR